MEIAFLTPEWLPFSTLCITGSLGVLCLCFMFMWLKSHSTTSNTPITETTETSEPPQDEVLEEYYDFVYAPPVDLPSPTQDDTNFSEAAYDNDPLPGLVFNEHEIENALFGEDEFGGNDFQHVVQTAQILANLNGARTPDIGKTRSYRDDISKARSLGVTREFNNSRDIFENQD